LGTPVPSTSQGGTQQTVPEVDASCQPMEFLPSHDNILEIQPYVVSRQQLPSQITRIVNKTGKTRNSAMLTCMMQNGQLCLVSRRQLITILGDAAVQLLLDAFSAQ
jgi:hypothetical protein